MSVSICVIPARGGSKRIPRKNIKSFMGKPIICWSIEAALSSRCFDQVMVSTDDEEIADEAIKAGAQVPFMRPEALSGDNVATVPVISHAIQAWEETSGTTVTAACCLYPTAPLVRPEDLRQAKLQLNDRCDYVVSVTEFEFPVQRGVALDQEEHLKFLYPQHLTTRSQDLPRVYHDAGQFYWGHKASWVAGLPALGSGAKAWKIPRYRVQDIDTQDDWRRAELMVEALLRTESRRS